MGIATKSPSGKHSPWVQMAAMSSTSPAWTWICEPWRNMSGFLPHLDPLTESAPVFRDNLHMEKLRQVPFLSDPTFLTTQSLKKKKKSGSYLQMFSPLSEIQVSASWLPWKLLVIKQKQLCEPPAAATLWGNLREGKLIHQDHLELCMPPKRTNGAESSSERSGFQDKYGNSHCRISGVNSLCKYKNSQKWVLSTVLHPK